MKLPRYDVGTNSYGETYECETDDGRWCLYEDVVEFLSMTPPPIQMVLHCPLCHHQHIDKPEPSTGWMNPPHRTHLCANCKALFRPANVATEGVAELPKS